MNQGEYFYAVIRRYENRFSRHAIAASTSLVID